MGVLCKTSDGPLLVEILEKMPCGKVKNVRKNGERRKALRKSRERDVFRWKIFLFPLWKSKKKIFDVEKANIFQQDKSQSNPAFLGFPRRFPQPVEKCECEKGNSGISFRFRASAHSGKIYVSQENSLQMLLISYSNALSSDILLLITSMEERIVV